MMLTTTASMPIASSSSTSMLSSINNYHSPRFGGGGTGIGIGIISINNYHPRLGCGRKRFISCEIALKADASPTTVDSISSSSAAEPNEDELNQLKVGSRVRVKVPLKVFHVPKVPEVDITGMEGKIKQYVGLWKGKQISANLPFKVEFVTEIEGRGPVKFVAHLKEDEFEYLDEKN